MPKMSLSFMIISSSPSILISVPDHLPNRIWSPALTSIEMRAPVSSLAPAPTDTTSPRCGFSLAVSGMIKPPDVFSSSSVRRTKTRSCRGGKQHGNTPFQDFQIGVACLETCWHSPHQSANIVELAMVRGDYNRAKKYISSKMLFPRMSLVAVDLKALLHLFTSNGKISFSGVGIRCRQHFRLFLLWLLCLFVTVFTFGHGMSFQIAAIRCRNGSGLTAVVHPLPIHGAGWC